MVLLIIVSAKRWIKTPLYACRNMLHLHEVSAYTATNVHNDVSFFEHEYVSAERQK